MKNTWGAKTFTIVSVDAGFGESVIALSQHLGSSTLRFKWPLCILEGWATHELRVCNTTSSKTG
jgi:hypothetical protein